MIHIHFIEFKNLHKSTLSKWFTLMCLSLSFIGCSEINVIPTRNITSVDGGDGNLEPQFATSHRVLVARYDFATQTDTLSLYDFRDESFRAEMTLSWPNVSSSSKMKLLNIGDINEDRYDDFLGVRDNITTDIVAYSGFDLSEIYRVRVASGNEDLCAGMTYGDRNGDGVEDFVTGQNGSVFKLRSGKTGEILTEVTHSGNTVSTISCSNYPIEDVTGDGLKDLAVLTGFDQVRRVWTLDIFDGDLLNFNQSLKELITLHPIDNNPDSDDAGTIMPLTDFNGDGIKEFAFSRLQKFEIYDGRTKSQIQEFSPNPSISSEFYFYNLEKLFWNGNISGRIFSPNEYDVLVLGATANGYQEGTYHFRLQNGQLQNLGALDQSSLRQIASSSCTNWCFNHMRVVGDINNNGSDDILYYSYSNNKIMVVDLYSRESLFARSQVMNHKSEAVFLSYEYEVPAEE